MTRELPRIVYILFILNACYYLSLGFPGGPVIKNLSANAGDTGSIPGSGRSPGGGNGNPLEYSCLGNPMDRGAWLATVHGVTKSQTNLPTKRQFKHNSEREGQKKDTLYSFWL